MDKERSGLVWALGGTLVLVVLLLAVVLLRPREGVPEQFALKTRRLELATQIRFGLASAAEAEKSAVLATTDEDSKRFADQARAATALVERRRLELTQLLTRGTPREKELLAQFSDAFSKYQHVDQELLDLAGKNTNLKATALAFGPAAQAVTAMDVALTPLVASANPKVVRLAAAADAAVLRIQALLPAHIAEESDQKMDALEAQMTKQAQEADKDLKALSAIVSPSERPALDAAASGYAKLAGLETQILKLSRENTNVRSLSISLNEKRKVTLISQDALEALERTIEQEPTGLKTPVNPR